MSELIRKTYRLEVKSVDEESGVITALIPVSTGAMDREGEVIEPSAWKAAIKQFNRRPVLVSSHDYRDLRHQIGEVPIEVTEQGLMAKPKYYIGQGNEEADWGFKLAAKGMAAYSVGFIPGEWTDGDGKETPRRTYTKISDLLEVSQVIVPSNREAIQGLRGYAGPVVKQMMEDVLKDDKLLPLLATPIPPVTKPEETEQYFRVPVPKEEGKHDGHRIRTIDISAEQGIKGLYCGECKVVITYLFDKEHDWTMAKAEAWVKEHAKGANPVSQNEIKDELDYAKSLIAKGNLSEEAKTLTWELVRETMRLPGADIPVDILQKIGAVLNAKNKGNLKQAQDLIQEVLDSAEKPTEEGKTVDSTELAAYIAEEFVRATGLRR